MLCPGPHVVVCAERLRGLGHILRHRGERLGLLGHHRLAEESQDTSGRASAQRVRM